MAKARRRCRVPQTTGVPHTFAHFANVWASPDPRPSDFHLLSHPRLPSSPCNPFPLFTLVILYVYNDTYNKVRQMFHVDRSLLHWRRVDRGRGAHFSYFHASTLPK